MTNIHKLKQSSKNITTHLKTLYPIRDEAVRVLDRISHKIAHLEKAKKNCQDSIKAKRKE